MKLSNESVVVELKNSTVVQVACGYNCMGLFTRSGL